MKSMCTKNHAILFHSNQQAVSSFSTLQLEQPSKRVPSNRTCQPIQRNGAQAATELHTWKRCKAELWYKIPQKLRENAGKRSILKSRFFLHSAVHPPGFFGYTLIGVPLVLCSMLTVGSVQSKVCHGAADCWDITVAARNSIPRTQCQLRQSSRVQQLNLLVRSRFFVPTRTTNRPDKRIFGERRKVFRTGKMFTRRLRMI